MELDAADRRDRQDFVWRRLDGHLWAGRTVRGPVGLVEHGRLYVATDGEGGVFGRFRTLEEAQRAVERGGPAKQGVLSNRGTTALVALGAVLIAVAIVGAALLALS